MKQALREEEMLVIRLAEWRGGFTRVEVEFGGGLVAEKDVKDKRDQKDGGGAVDVFVEREVWRGQLSNPLPGFYHSCALPGVGPRVLGPTRGY